MLLSVLILFLLEFLVECLGGGGRCPSGALGKFLKNSFLGGLDSLELLYLTYF